MIHNPYAKKRPRPDQFTNENDATRCVTNASVAAAPPVPKATSNCCLLNESQPRSVGPSSNGASSSSSSSSSNGGLHCRTSHALVSHNERSKSNHHPSTDVSQSSLQPDHPCHSLKLPHSTMETATTGHMSLDQDVRPTLSQPLIRNPYVSRTSNHVTASQVRMIPKHVPVSFCNNSVTPGVVHNQSQSVLASTTQASSSTTTTMCITGAATKVPTVHQLPCLPPTASNAVPLYKANPYKKNVSVPSQPNQGPVHTSTAFPRHPTVQGLPPNRVFDSSISVNANFHQWEPEQSSTIFDEATMAISNDQIMASEPSSPLTCPPPPRIHPRPLASPFVEATPQLSAWEPQKSPLLERLESFSAITTDPDPPKTLPSDCVAACTDPNPTISLTNPRTKQHTTYHKPSPSSLRPFQQLTLPSSKHQDFENHEGSVPKEALAKLPAVTTSTHLAIQSSITNKRHDPSVSNPYNKKSVAALNVYAPKNSSSARIPAVGVLAQQAISSALSTSPSRPSQVRCTINQQPTLSVLPCTESQKKGVASHVVPMINASDTQTACQTRSPPQATQNPKQPGTAGPVHSMASMRPQSWVNNSAKPQAPSTSKIAPLPLATQLQAATQTQTQPSKVELPGEDLLPPELRFSPEDLKPISDEYRQRLVANADISKPLLNGWALFNHQKKAILQGIQMRRIILALDMGLGKTLVGCVWGKAFQRTFDCLKILVICPASLKEEWKRTAENATGLRVEEETSSKQRDIQSLDMKISTWAKVPVEIDSAVRQYVVVCDEAHLMQSMTASRTKDVLQLVSDKRCEGVLLLTGTPMKNGKPCNLFPLLRAVDHPLGKHQMAFEKHFCAGAVKSYGGKRPMWDASGSSNLEQLKRLVSSHLLHLTKEDCLSSLPPLTREVRKVPVSSRCRLQYSEAIQNLAKVHATASNHDHNSEVILGAVQRLRVVCSLAKMSATTEVAKKVLEKEPAVVVFTSFVQVAKQLYQQLADSGWQGELLTGETPAKKRQAMVDNFQAGLSPVFICTFGAGGVGLTLTAAHTVILVDRPWTPGDTRQAEDRVRRIGQTKPVTSIWMSAFDMDTHVDQMLESKTQTSDAVLMQGRTSTAGLSASIVKRLLASLAPGTG